MRAMQLCEENTLDKEHGDVSSVRFVSSMAPLFLIIRLFLIMIIIGAVSLLILGMVMLIIGLHWYRINHKGYTPFFIVGTLITLPAIYGVYEGMGTLRGWAGFEQPFYDPDADDDSWTFTL